MTNKTATNKQWKPMLWRVLGTKISLLSLIVCNCISLLLPVHSLNNGALSLFQKAFKYKYNKVIFKSNLFFCVNATIHTSAMLKQTKIKNNLMHILTAKSITMTGSHKPPYYIKNRFFLFDSLIYCIILCYTWASSDLTTG